MIKLVVSDIDGTALLPGQDRIPEELFESIRQLKSRSIDFAVATGRPYKSIRELFEPVKDDIIYLSNNGAEIYASDMDLSSFTGGVIDRSLLPELLESLVHEYGFSVIVATDVDVYVFVQPATTFDAMEKYLHCPLRLVTSYREIEGQTYKVSAFNHGQYIHAVDELRDRFGAGMIVAHSARDWVDFSVRTKGEALSALCSYLGIEASHICAFGDSENDMEMLDYVGMPYIMKDSKPELLSRYPNHCVDVSKAIMELINKELSENA